MIIKYMKILLRIFLFIRQISLLRDIELYHPESPGMKITITRSWIGRLSKPKDFATISECCKSYRLRRKYKML
jgi:hypothetical protein